MPTAYEQLNLLARASHVNALGVIRHRLEKRESNATSSLVMCNRRGLGNTEVDIVGQRYILQSRGIYCGTEICVAEMKYILWSKGTFCEAYCET